MKKYILFLVIILGLVALFVHAYFTNSSSLLVSLLGRRHKVDIQNINEEVIGQKPNDIDSIYYNKDGNIVGYNKKMKKDFFYIKDNKILGPYNPITEYSEKGFNLKILMSPGIYKYLTPTGWPDDLYYRNNHLYIGEGIEPLHSAGGHTIAVRGAGGSFFATGNRKQAEVLYDGKVVGKEEAAGKHYQPIKGNETILSDDGLHYAYIVRYNLGTKVYLFSPNASYVVLDGKRSKIFLHDIENIHFEKNFLIFNTVSDSQFLRVKIPVQ